ncbi:MAG TPA: hypothetical protein VD968_00510 [Pyrinomonadaceae bacterium]|nr:hypothetical protein [Pyrinomonadaceae bacterium]
MSTTTTTIAPATTAAPATSRRRRWPKVAAALLLALLAWAAFDLYGPRSTSLRDFDADEVARLETAMTASPSVFTIEPPSRAISSRSTSK